MSKFPQLRILHLSDFHYHTRTKGGLSNHICDPPDPTGSTAGFPLLLDLVQKDLNSADWSNFGWALGGPGLPVPRLIVAATGDFAHTARGDEFDKAQAFLAGLCDASCKNPILGSRVSARDIFVVPGNHDVIYDQKEPKHRFSPYCDFYNSIFKDIQPNQRGFARPEEVGSLTQIHLSPQDRLLVAEINSSYYVEKDTFDESRGQVDYQTIAALRQALERVKNDTKDWIKIALVHHHPILIPSFIEAGRGVDAIMNAGSLLRLLKDNGFQLILHGHKHFPQVFSYDPDPGWSKAQAQAPQLVVAGGSAGSSSLPDGINRSNTYNVITIKWIPDALQARVQIVTRGLTRWDGANELDPDQWSWSTFRVYDKVVTPYLNYPLSSSSREIPFPKPSDEFEPKRTSNYGRLRYNMPVVEVFPSLIPEQGYEAKVWLEPHRPDREIPTRVVWSAGPRFPRGVCEPSSGSDFSNSFHYWGPMLIQCIISFKDGDTQEAYVYARMPDSKRTR